MPLLAVLALAAVPQGGYPDLVERIGDPRWMMEALQSGEAVVGADWVSDATDRELRIEGAGVLASVWADPPAGRLLFHLPGEEEPLLVWDLAAAAAEDAPMPFVAPLAERVGRGWSCLVPVPFRAGLRLVHEPDPERPARIQLAVRVQDEPSGLPELHAGLLSDPASERALRRVASALRRGARPEAAAEIMKVGPVSFHDDAKPGVAPDSGELQWSFRGHGVLRWLELTFLGGLPKNVEETMRAMTLRIELGATARLKEGRLLFEVPLGDLLGSGADPTAAGGAFADYDRESQRFRFRLPIAYRDGMKVILRQIDREPIAVRLDCGADPVADPADLPPLTLHVGWIGGDGPLPTLHATGPARLAGWTLTTVGSSSAPWQFDGAAAFASAADRGRPNRFVARPVHEGPGGFGRSVLTRFHGLGAPVSAQLLEFTPGIEFGVGAVRWGVLAWWYAPPDATSDWDDPSDWESRRPPPSAEADFPRVAGVLEGEALAVFAQTRGSTNEVRRVPGAGEGWSGLRYLHWTGAAGSQCNLRFPVRKAGEYRVLVNLAMGADFGQVEMLLDGVSTGEALDCSAADGKVRPSGEIEIARLRMIPRDDHVLSLRTRDGLAVGLDYLRLEPVQSGAEEGE